MGWVCKKVENGGSFLNAGRIMYSIGIFYFTFYLFAGGGCVRTQCTSLDICRRCPGCAKLHVAAAIGRRDRQTDGRTDTGPLRSRSQLVADSVSNPQTMCDIALP